MIAPPGRKGVAFTGAGEGDMREDMAARGEVSRAAGISPRWAQVAQVHGAAVVEVDGPGTAGEADAMWTTRRGLPLAVFTADCFGVVLQAPGAVGVAHAGWRGARAGVITALWSEMRAQGHRPTHAFLGPGIGPCCFEVGPEVAAQFPGHRAVTTWGTESVDLEQVISAELKGLSLWTSGQCTRHQAGFFSHRRDETSARMATLGWLS